MKLCIYHANCLDGFGAAYCHWRAHVTDRDEWQYVPMNYGEINTVDELLVKFPQLQNTTKPHNVNVLDFSFPADITQFLITATNIKFTMLDHHKTAFEMIKSLGYLCEYPQTYKILTPTALIQLDNDRSGALQAADYFVPPISGFEYGIMRHIDDRDRWQFKLQDTKEYCAALANWPQDFSLWKERIHDTNYGIFSEGATLLAHKQKLCEQIAAEHVTRQIWNHSVKLCNCPPQFASEVGNILAGQGQYIGACYHITKEGKVKFSLRSIGDVDVSKIAREYGGGGHKNAAGFTTPLSDLESFYDYAEHYGV